MHTGKFRKLEEGQFCILCILLPLRPLSLLYCSAPLHAGWDAVTPTAPPLLPSTGWDPVTPTAPPLSASPRGLGGRCHAPCSAPFAVHGLGAVGESGKGQALVVQVQPINSLSRKKIHSFQRQVVFSEIKGIVLGKLSLCNICKITISYIMVPEYERKD